jgi:O-acetyl-ADP-ribose deacetylase (regulator of RNase III)
MGVVYRGRHRLLDQQVAIKFCVPGQEIERFQREAKLLASVRSPHAVPVHDFDLLPDGRAMLVMDWVAGHDLRKLLQDNTGPFPESRVVPWMLQVCEAMRAVAAQGIVHRDLKPSNILVDQRDHAHVADFGLARAAHAEQLTLVGGIMGTPHYMAPEQAEDPHGVDTRADIYSFGATFYHLLTGQPPFQGDTAFTILFRHKTEPLIAPKSRMPSLSARLNDCLERCLAKSPRDRFQTFANIVSHLCPETVTETSWDQSEDPEIARQQERYRSRRSIYLGSRPDLLPEPDAYHFPNCRTCTVGFGNLVEQRVDALVSSDDELLTMGSGVSAELCSVAGGDYGEAGRRYAPVRPGRAVVTPAGSLPARFVLHGVMMNRWGAEKINPSRDLLNEIMESCFYHADTLGLRSIAFPLLGTGTGGFSREVCLDTMFRFLSRKLAHGLTTVQDVRIVIFSPGLPRR